MRPNNAGRPTNLPSRRVRTPHMTNKKKRRSFGRTLRNIFLILFTIGLLGTGWFYLTPWGTKYRLLLADTIITTQHRVWAKYLIGEKGLKERVEAYNKHFIEMGVQEDTSKIETNEAAKSDSDLIKIEDVSGDGFVGYLMTISDPTKIRIGVTDTLNKGEQVSHMVSRLGALAGINAGGFVDPNWDGNGFQPIGLVIANGQVYYDGGIGNKARTQIVGIDKTGRMIAGNYTIPELTEMGVKEAVTFQPRIISNGKGYIKNAAEGWGIAPRTVMGQRADGAIMFLVIDGRQAHSIGANLYDCQQIMLAHGAVIAANLDGGSSTVMVKGNELVSSPSSKYGQRYLPTAFLVFDNPDAVNIPNIWAGLDPRKIDPSKK